MARDLKILIALLAALLIATALAHPYYALTLVALVTAGTLLLRKAIY